MNHFPWLGPWRAARSCALGLLCLNLACPWAHAQSTETELAAPSMTQALAAAWKRSLAAAETQGRHAQAQASQSLAHSWLAAPASVSLSQRQGRHGPPQGSRETEVGLALPLWAWGERAAGTLASDAEQRWAEAGERAARLRLSGELRDVAAAVRAAEGELAQVERQAVTLVELARDVERRVAAGDLAPADALAADAESLAAGTQVRSARVALERERARWRLLTGLTQVPAEAAADLEVSAGELPPSHPELAFADATLELARRRVELAQAQRASNSEVSFGLRQERPGQGGVAQNSWVVSLQVPFGDGAHRQPRVASALSDAELARVQAHRVMDALQAELGLARAQLRAAREQHAAERRRAALLNERAQLIDRSFRAGEDSLPELLRALGAASLAEAASARHLADMQSAEARLRQALGMLP